MKTVRTLGLFFLVVSAQPAVLHAQSCDALSKSGSATVTITLATTVATGSFTPPGNSEALENLPPFCRVAATLKPTADSNIKTEVWLPVSNWNGKLMAVGSGGWGGIIFYGELADALRRGYAASATDDGHGDAGASFIMGHPQKLIDFSYRSEHEMTLEAKTLIQAYYGRQPQHSYWDGCSGGGREGLLQTARYPDEFDGVIVGDPADVRRNAWALWLAQQTFKDPASYIPPQKYPMIHRAVLEACDANDGLKDGLIENPPSCQIDFKILQCKGADGPDCLTRPQVQSAQTLITPATTPSGQILFPRLEPGTELGWARMAGGPNPGELFLDQFRYLVYQDPDWDWRSFDLERDAAKAHAVNKDILELDPHLAAFAKRGGKLLIYHGWADQQVAPGSSIEFYESVIRSSPQARKVQDTRTAESSLPQAADWVRLFMVPGMGHCSGGEGPDTFDTVGALEQWVEHGVPPAKIIAAHKTRGQVDRTRPLCPYPQSAHYNGSGSIDEAVNFTCRSP